ncbi:hypothetical protein CPB85DRAFT_190820 [Mucidula mucida]|nr:hypothetical protein CPB85DRAFT_190820 [Mucidula mucida]
MAYFLPLTRVIATSNAEQYHVVEITGAPNGSYIRERILSKLCIPDDSHSHFRIYRSQVGAYATSNELSDSTIFDLCTQHGDASDRARLFRQLFAVQAITESPPLCKRVVIAGAEVRARLVQGGSHRFVLFLYSTS